MRLRGVATSGDEHFAEGALRHVLFVLSHSLGIARAGDILNAFLVGLEEIKMPKIVQLSVGCIYRLIENDAVDPVGL